LLFTGLAQAAPFRLIEVRGTINPGSASYILETIKTAEAEQAEGVILRLDTPGGLLSSTREIIQGISQSAVPFIVFVSPGGASATSAGALITLSAHVAAMAPGTIIGAAHPVGQGGEEVKGPMGDKVTNDTAALARSQAALRGRNEETAALIVTKSQSYSPTEAVKSGAVDFVAADLNELLTKMHGRKVTVENPRREVTIQSAGEKAEGLALTEMNLRQKFLHLIADPNISTMLLALGALAVYVEVSSGFSLVIPGIVGVFCVLLGAISLQMLPINVGGALLFALGFLLLAAEIWVTSFGLLTVAALVCLFLGGLFLIDPSAGTMQVSLGLLIPLVASMAVIMGMIGYMIARDRRGLAAGDSLVGLRGRVKRVEGDGRSGVARVNGELWNIESDETLQTGDEVLVTEVDGMRLRVKK
jgi:membrane-bound serine protease (ClpP class)